MLFKKLHRRSEESKKNSVEDKEDNKKSKVEPTPTASEEELASKRLRLWKKIQRKQRIKKVIIWLFLALAIIGGYKSLFEVEPTVKKEEISDSVFVTSYVEAYFEYPQSETSQTLLKNFTLKNEEQNSYEETLKSVQVSSVDLYKVKALKKDYPTYRYYAEVQLTITQTNQKPVVDTRYIEVDVAKEKNRYLVLAPPTFASYDVKAIVDEDIQKQLSLEKESTNQSLSDSEYKQLEETLHLFFKTYSDDYKQAKLLTSGSSVMDALDPHVSVQLSTIVSASQDDDYLYVQVKVEESDHYITRTRNYYIEITKENHKIQKMEVY